jgi:hypothetical protein
MIRDLLSGQGVDRVLFWLPPLTTSQTLGALDEYAGLLLGPR